MRKTANVASVGSFSFSVSTGRSAVNVCECIRERPKLKVSTMTITQSFAAHAPSAASRPLPSIFSIYATGLIAGGYSPLPRIIEDGRGRPAVKRWSDYCERQARPQELAAWSCIPNADISLACGLGGLIAIDVDDDRPEIIAAVRKALPQCTVARRGSKGFAFLARYEGGQPKTLNIYRADEARKDPLVEIMGIGRSIATPPSIHARTGNGYVWWNLGTGKAHLAAWQLPPLAGLSVVTAADIKRLISALSPWSRKPRPMRPVADSPAPALTDAVNRRYRAYALKGLADSTAGAPSAGPWRIASLPKPSLQTHSSRRAKRTGSRLATGGAR